MRKFIDLALAAAFASTSAAALADSKSAAQFALNTCLAAIGRPSVGRSHRAGTQLDKCTLRECERHDVRINVGGDAGRG